MRPLLPLLASSLLALLAACDRQDPYRREGEWRPVGANDENLRAMIAEPGDLLLGRAATGSAGDIGAAAVARLRNGRVKQLPDSSLAEVKVGAGGGSPDAGGAATAADAVAPSPLAASAAGAAP